METLLYTEAGKRENMPTTIEKQLVDLNVEIAQTSHAERRTKISDPHKNRNKEKTVRPNHLLRLL